MTSRNLSADIYRTRVNLPVEPASSRGRRALSVAAPGHRHALNAHRSGEKSHVRATRMHADVWGIQVT